MCLCASRYVFALRSRPRFAHRTFQATLRLRAGQVKHRGAVRLHGYLSCAVLYLHRLCLRMDKLRTVSAGIKPGYIRKLQAYRFVPVNGAEEEHPALSVNNMGGGVHRHVTGTAEQGDPVAKIAGVFRRPGAPLLQNTDALLRIAQGLISPRKLCIGRGA